ncbi:MAG: tRNA-dihydrouridine synthase [Candidatus Paceibacterota bacterium]
MSYLGFWGKLQKPVFVLAPMADVTDCAFRQIINKYGKPDVFWTEFVSADGLSHPQAREKLLIDLKYAGNEHPIIAQIFGGKPENIKEASKLCKELGFDGIDINMGCPDKSVEKQSAGAACIKDPHLAKEIIKAAKEGGGGLPVSVKTRIGYNKNEIETWIRELLSLDLAVLTVHLRTRKEMSDVPAHWDLMKRIVEIRDEVSPNTLIFGNGDVVDLEDAKRKVEETGCDGVMLGRAIFGNPWLFSGRIPSLKEKLQVMVEHTKLFEELLGEYKNFAIMKKHYKAYVNGFDGAKELRMKLMEAEDASQVENITNDFLNAI